MYVCDGYTGHKFDMGHGSSGFHCVLPAHRPRLGPMWFPADITAPLRVVFVEIAVLVAVLLFKVKHCQTGLFSTELSLGVGKS